MAIPVAVNNNTLEDTYCPPRDDILEWDEVWSFVNRRADELKLLLGPATDRRWGVTSVRPM
jgi:hypothetical protein